MSSPLFSVAGYLNKPIYTPNGLTVGQLIDIVGDERTGAFTYFIVEGSEEKLYAIHYSYFYTINNPDSLIFDQALGNSEQDIFLDLPTKFNDLKVYSCIDMLQSGIPDFVTAEHRSDDEFPL